MTNSTGQTYNTRATAIRGAKRKGYEESQIIVSQDKDERWYFTPKTDLPVGPYKAPKPGNNKVAMIWAFLAATPETERKAQIAELIAKGFKPNTVKTQTSRFYANQAARQDRNEQQEQADA